MNRPKKIDETNISDHYYLSEKDTCFYFFDYSIRKGATYSPGNQLIINLKKEPFKKNKPEWKYKEQAIEFSALLIWEAFGHHLSNYLITAIPPSKTKDDPDYDDRILKIIAKLKQFAFDNKFELKTAEIFITKVTREAMHSSQERWSPEEHAKNLTILNKDFIENTKGIIILDDVLITGSQYKGACISLKNELIQLPVFGIFIARGIR